jgi:cobalt-zinc-cadmium efflux system outer membrane protein
MARRLKAGDIAQADLAKIELEALRAKNAAIAARAELEQARQGLAARMGLMDPLLLPQHLTLPQQPAQQIQAVEALMATALHQRPDLAAVGAQMERADAEARLASREALPDVRLGVSYSRSHFMISGDNPHTLGFNVGMPLPVLDRNQPGRARAQLARQQARNDQGLLRIEVQRQVSQAVSRLQRAQAGLACFEGEGMLQKAERARSVAHRALSNGAFSLLDVLEAERTALEVQAEHLAMQYALHQAFVDIAYVTAQESL